MAKGKKQEKPATQTAEYGKTLAQIKADRDKPAKSVKMITA